MNDLAQVTPESLGIIVRDSQARVSSLTVAKRFRKLHKNIVRDIETKIFGVAPDNFNRLNFEPVKYLDAKGEMRKAYDMTRDGFTLLAMSFTGSEAMLWKIQYIRAFNWLEEQNRNHIKKTLMEQESRVADDEPYTIYGKLLASTEDLVSVGDFAKQICQHRIMTGRTRLLHWFHSKGYVLKPDGGKYHPSQKSIENGLLAYDVHLVSRAGKGIREKWDLSVTGKGQIRFAREIIREKLEEIQTARQKLLWPDVTAAL
jgi:Rha family phage regulatory protein